MEVPVMKSALDVVFAVAPLVSALSHTSDQHASVMEMTTLAQGMLMVTSAVVSNKCMQWSLK